MCDTIVALPNVTEDNSVIFGKNSDREPNEPQNLIYIPAKKHDPDSMVKCTYISVPQVEKTFAVLLSKPFWMFGCEMGANSQGVTIGNEAVWTKENYRKKGLLGMDLMRLALERAPSARKALDIIIDLIDRYGQGGACGYTDKNLFYHNSFLIADPTEAWVLETADKYWIAERVKDFRAISNTLTIGKDYDLIHPELINHTIEEGYCDSEDDFHFANCFIPKFSIKQIGAKGKSRIDCTTQQLQKKIGKLTPRDFISILRSHNTKPSEANQWTPDNGSMKDPCMHYKSFITPSQSTASLVSHLKKNMQVHWATGTSAPCTSLYKPIFLPVLDLNFKLKKAKEHYDPQALWWRHEKLHRLILMDYQKRINAYRLERNQIESSFFRKVYGLLLHIPHSPSGEDISEFKKITTEAFQICENKIDEWINVVQNLSIESKPGYFYRRRWKKLNDDDNLNLN
ncbi:MAG: C69 family dipeptidase [Promethearchaeia archaeon]